MKFFQKVTAVISVLFFTLALVACEQEGSAEKAGKKLDDTLNTAKEKIHDATK